MKDEIKEILDNLKDIDKTSILKNNDAKILLDYITNLQKQIEEYQKALDETMSEKIDLQEEIERQSKAQVILDDMLADYKSRIDKAVEYIKEHTDKLKTIRVPKIDFDYNEVLEILKGDK